MELNDNLTRKIIESNGKKKGGIVLTGLKILSEELEKFRFKPKNNNKDLLSLRSYKQAESKLKRVEYQPFSVVGVSGSTILKKGHDLDIIFLPCEGITSGIFITALVDFTDKFKKVYKKKTGKRAICFSVNAIQEEVEYLSKRKSEELLLQFVSLSDHFYGKNIQNPEGVSSWMPDYSIYSGKFGPINDIPYSKRDRLYLALDLVRVFGAEYPSSLVKEKYHLMKWISKKMGLKPKDKSKTIKEVVNLHRDLCMITDYTNEWVNPSGFLKK